jgi:uncharacterized membrane protein YhaH (DUF805 family)
MLRGLFGDVMNGRLARLTFLGYWVLLTVLVVTLGIGIGFAIGAAEHLMGGDLQAAQDQLRERFGGPAVIAIAVVFGAFAFAGLNIEAKRLRDIGLPGWWGVLGILVASTVLSFALSDEAASAFALVVLIALLLVPTGALGGPSGKSS